MQSTLEACGRTWRRAACAALLLGLTAGCSLPARKPAAATREPVAEILMYAESTRALQGPELAQEIARLNRGATPADQLRLALALSWTHQPNDLVRAQGLLQRLLDNPGDEAKPLKALAGLLVARFAEQRRLQDLLDRQNGQLRDLQHRVDQTQDKLNALKEIERSLNNRGAAAAPALPPSGPAQPHRP